MALKSKDRPSTSLFGDDDFLESLFDNEKQPLRSKGNRSRPLTRSSEADDMFSKLAEQVKGEGLDLEDSDVSAADPSDILKNMENIDEMEADLFATKKKPNANPVQAKLPNGSSKKDPAVSENNADPFEADMPAQEGKKQISQNIKKFPLFDDSAADHSQEPDLKGVDDPLNDLLDDLLPEETKHDAKAEKSVPLSPILKNNSKPPLKKGMLSFNDEDDDFMGSLGFESEKAKPKKNETSLWSTKEKSDAPRRARTKIDDILEGFSSTRPPEQPSTFEKKEPPPLQERQEKNPTTKEEDITFGSYQPTVGPTAEGRLSRRQSVRFSTEDISATTPEKKPKPITPTSIRRRNSSDWLGLKTNIDLDYLDDEPKMIKTSTDSTKAPVSPLLRRQPSLTGNQMTPVAEVIAADVPTEAKAEIPKSQRKDQEEEEGDWLSGALNRRKTLGTSTKQEKEEDEWLIAALSRKKMETEGKTFKREDSSFLIEKTEPESTFNIQDKSKIFRSKEDSLINATGPAAHSTPVIKERSKQDRHSVQMQKTSTLAELETTYTADSMRNLLLQHRTLPSYLLRERDASDAGNQRFKHEQQLGDYQALQAQIVQLEGQIKILQMERDQSQMMLENVQQRHKLDVELMENTHKARVKLLEDSAAQRETRAHLECEDLMERMTALTRSAEEERSALQAQYHRKLAQVQEDRDREVERLRDLQRKSISEMRKDHEDQLQRLKKLKDVEIDAVTSATSQTRSLSGVIEQMEQFSSRLEELSSRVETTHEHTAQGLEQGARHRDEQLRALQERLAQQQKATVEERTYLKEIISRMDAQLSEQQRQIEKERWKVTTEQAKAESLQRSLDEERRVLTMQMGMEREELERAKTTLLEEQKSVMQHCAEERRKLAAEWANFHNQEKQRHERAERDVNSLLEKREGSIITLAQEQADLKLRTAEFNQREMAVAQEKESLERLREELDREKERINTTAMRLKTRAQEVEAFSQLAAEKFAEGERALKEAKRVEAEHEARLKTIQSQTEHLRLQEQQLLKERMKLNHVQEDTGKLKINSITPLTQILPPVLPESVSVLPIPELTTHTLSLNSLSSTQSMTLEASLALWKYASEKDREFLQEEQIFLENLKRKSYRLNTI